MNLPLHLDQLIYIFNKPLFSFFLLPFMLTIIKSVFKDLEFLHSLSYAFPLSLFPLYPTQDLDSCQKSLSSVILDHQVTIPTFSNLTRLKNKLMFVKLTFNKGKNNILIRKIFPKLFKFQFFLFNLGLLCTFFLW